MDESDPIDRSSIEAALEAERALTQARLASLDRAFDDIVAYSDGTPPDDEHDPEGATVAWERGQLVALRTQAVRHLEEIDAARKRLDAGGFGVCERCGCVVDPARLLARPTTERCVRCAPLL